MLQFSIYYGALAFCSITNVQSIPVPAASASAISSVEASRPDIWRDTLSNDTRLRLDVARQHLQDESALGQAFRNDTIMRVNIEREALDLSFIDLSQAFGMQLPAPRATVARVGFNKRSNAEDFREEAYTRSGGMTYPKVIEQRSNAEDFREEAYTRSGGMTYPKAIEQRSNTIYSSLSNRDSLALGAIERINIAHRVLRKPELTDKQANEIGSHGDDYISEYWHSSTNHGNFWTSDQAVGKPNFIEGGQANGFGFTQSTFHKLHCLANLRTMLARHITGNGTMTRDMNIHGIHCLEYIRWRELQIPDLTNEPIDTVDYKGRGIH